MNPSPSSRPGCRLSPARVLVGSAAFLMAVPLLVGAGSAVPAGAQLEPSGSSNPAEPALPDMASGQSSVALPGLGGVSHEITLITGDRVALNAVGDTRYSLDVEPARRPDGSVPEVMVEARGEGVYVWPEDVLPLIDAGVVDRKLFDVEYLAANGYADADNRRLPVIVEYPRRLSTLAQQQRAKDLPASQRGVTLESIDAAGLAVTKELADRFWAALISDADQTDKASTQSAELAGGVERVWLDRRVTVDLDESAPQIGAQEAWAAGFDGTGVTLAVLDTGVDATHPDVAGRVVASRSFVPDQEVADGHGHGTHVASTIVGSGSASDGRYRGVAPGAELVVGKVLDNSGNGLLSGVIDGMEWATLEQGVDVVSMSLSGDPTDGADPGSQAVNRLTEQTGALFVIAAGNTSSGAPPFSVGSPGAADAALTVGAVDKTDRLADFSNRGPRVGDYAIKPEITAPGVAITAARAAGTSMGDPVDEFYTTASGTSMATPHVAGAAAILAEQRPAWDAAQLKAALVSSAEDGGYTVYEQGAGRVDIARAVRQPVQVTPATGDFGLIRFNSRGEPVSKTLTYTNQTDQAITLDLITEARTVDGDAVPDDTLIVDPSTLDVPAGGAASVTATLDPATVDAGTYTGSVVATGANGTRLTTPVGFVLGEQQHRLTVRFTGAEATTGYGFSVQRLAIVGVQDSDDFRGDTSLGFGDHDYFVEPGAYSVQAWVRWIDTTDGVTQTTYLIQPEVTVAGDTVVVLDVSTTRKIMIDTPKPTGAVQPDSGYAHKNKTLSYLRWAPDLAEPYRWLLVSFVTGRGVWLTPTEPTTIGHFLLGSQFNLGPPDFSVEVTRPERITLHGVRIRPFTGTRTVDLVDVGAGTPQELARLDVEGKAALLAEGQCAFRSETIQRVVDAGAEAVVTTPDRPFAACAIESHGANDFAGTDMPWAAIPYVEAERVRGLLADSPVRLRLTSTMDPPAYVYRIRLYEEDSIPDSLRYTLTEDELTTIDHDVHSGQPADSSPDFSGRIALSGFKPEENFVLRYSVHLDRHPVSFTEYVGPVDPEVVVHHQFYADHPTLPHLSSMARLNVFDQSERRRWGWYDSPPVPAANLPTEAQTIQPGRFQLSPCSGCRQGDTFYPWVSQSASSDEISRGTADQGLHILGVPPTNWHLYRGSEEVSPGSVPIAPGLPIGAIAYELPPEPHEYRLTHRVVGWAGLPDQTVDTEWTFTSGTVERDEITRDFACGGELVGSTAPCRPEPLIFLRYDLGLDLFNRVRAPGSHAFEVTAYRQPSQAEPPAIKGLRLWVSYDGGDNWRRARVTSLDDDRFKVRVVHPPKQRRASDLVSIKAEAWDVDGDRVEQTIQRAYVLQ